ncbi:putative reverse transcriptase domain-containing protein [Tanacetum coccineum]
MIILRWRYDVIPIINISRNNDSTKERSYVVDLDIELELPKGSSNTLGIRTGSSASKHSSSSMSLLGLKSISLSPVKRVSRSSLKSKPATSMFSIKKSTTYSPKGELISKSTSPLSVEEKTLEYMLRAYVLDFGGRWDVHLPLVEFSYNNSYHSSMRCAPFEALYGRKCRSPIMWAKIGEGHFIRPELVQETTEKISQIKDKLKAACDRHKSYADKRRKPLEFSVGEYVLLKVSPWKGVVHFGKRGNLHLGLNGVHETFHVSNLKKCLVDPTLQITLDEIQVDAKLNFMEEPVEILEREFKKPKRSRIIIVKVR